MFVGWATLDPLAGHMFETAALKHGSIIKRVPISQMNLKYLKALS